MTEKSQFDQTLQLALYVISKKKMDYNMIFLILIFWVCAAIGSDFRSGYRTSSHRNSIDTKEKEMDAMNKESSNREEKSKLVDII